MILKVLPLLSLVWCSNSLELSHQHSPNPVYLLDQKYIVIDGYHGALNGKTLELFGNVETLVIQNCNFTLLSENYLNPLKNLRKLVFANSHFERAKNDISVCCKKLREFILIESQVGPIDKDTLTKISSMKALERLMFLRVDFPFVFSIGLTWPNLKELEIVDSKLDTIEDGALKGMEKLEVLDLRNNNLKKIPTTILGEVKTLRELNLAGNHLEKVTTDDFPHLPLLEKLILGHNPIKEIKLKGLKEKLPNIKRVDISGIDITPSEAEGIPLLKV